MAGKHRVVIVGGGFAGLWAARGLGRSGIRVSLVDRRNFHLFQPLLYQVATGALSPGDIASPLRHLVRRDERTEVVLAEVTGVDVERRVVVTGDEELAYDTLLLATGSSHHYFGNDAWQAHAPGLKTVEDAIAVRHRILLAFERAERESDAGRRREWLTFVVVGAGPTGVELAGALGEIANDMRSDFRHIDTTAACIVLVEGLDRVLPSLHPDLSALAAASLARLGVTVRVGEMVTSVGAGHVSLAKGESEERLATRTILWAAGVRAHPLGAMLAAATGTPTDRQGRVRVGPDLSVPGHPEIFVAGDLARVDGPDGDPLPGLAPVAIAEGRYVARVVAARLAGRSPPPPFTYRHQRTMATIGRGSAVAQLGAWRLGGFGAWLAWLFVHLMGLVEPENRAIVMMQWAWSFVTRNRGARLITGPGRPDRR